MVNGMGQFAYWFKKFLDELFSTAKLSIIGSIRLYKLVQYLLDKTTIDQIAP